MATTTSTETITIDKGGPSVSQPHPQAPEISSQRSTPADPIEPLEIAEDEAQYPTGTKYWLNILTICVVLILGGLDNNIVATAVPSITDHFHTVADVGWYASAFRLCNCACQFMFGKMYKLFSIKKVFLLSMIIFLFGSILCATATSSKMFVVGRAVTGVGAAGEIAGCFAISIVTTPLRKRPVFAGLMACVESMAIIAAPIVGGLITGSIGWRWCFWINLPIGAVTLASIMFLFSDPPVRHDGGLTFKQKVLELDLLSNLLFIPALTTLFVALSWAGTKYPWTDGRVIGLFVVCAVLLAAFMYNQYRRGDSAALPFRIITQRSVIAGFIFTMCTNSMTNLLEYYLPTYWQVVKQVSPGASGVRMIPILGGMMLGLFLQGIGTTTLGYYAPFMLFASVCMPIAAGLMTTSRVNSETAQIMAYSGFAGFAGGIGFQGSQSAVQTTLSAADVNLGIGVVLFGQSFGPAVAIAIGQVIFTNKLATNLKGVVPGLTPAFVENHGLGDLKNAVPKERWPEVVAGIDQSLTQTWYLAVALGCTTMVGSLLVEWRSVKHKQS